MKVLIWLVKVKNFCALKNCILYIFSFDPITQTKVTCVKVTAGFRKRLEGKVALVTGAARGIGHAAAVALAREGTHIVGIDICASVF